MTEEAALARVLLENPHLVNELTGSAAYDRRTRAQLACYAGDQCRLELLVTFGSDVNFNGGSGSRSCVEIASEKGDPDPPLKHDLRECTMRAGADHVECVKFLMERGADVDVPNASDYRAIHWAAIQGGWRSLLGAYGSARLTAAAGSTRCVQQLVQRGVDLNARAGNSLPLHMASQCGERGTAPADVVAVFFICSPRRTFRVCAAHVGERANRER
jgi:ankyrin repeat protein